MSGFFKMSRREMASKQKLQHNFSSKNDSTETAYNTPESSDVGVATSLSLSPRSGRDQRLEMCSSSHGGDSLQQEQDDNGCGVIMVNSTKVVSGLQVPDGDNSKIDLIVIGGRALDSRIRAKEVRITGTFDGTLGADSLYIAAGGCVMGAITAKTATIAGSAHGTLNITGRLTICSSGSVLGRVHYGSLKTVKGAKLTGDVDRRSRTPPITPPAAAGTSNQQSTVVGHVDELVVIPQPSTSTGNVVRSAMSSGSPGMPAGFGRLKGAVTPDYSPPPCQLPLNQQLQQGGPPRCSAARVSHKRVVTAAALLAELLLAESEDGDDALISPLSCAQSVGQGHGADGGKAAVEFRAGYDLRGEYASNGTIIDLIDCAEVFDGSTSSRSECGGVVVKDDAEVQWENAARMAAEEARTRFIRAERRRLTDCPADCSSACSSCGGGGGGASTRNLRRDEQEGQQQQQERKPESHCVASKENLTAKDKKDGAAGAIVTGGGGEEVVNEGPRRATASDERPEMGSGRQGRVLSEVKRIEQGSRGHSTDDVEEGVGGCDTQGLGPTQDLVGKSNAIACANVPVAQTNKEKVKSRVKGESDQGAKVNERSAVNAGEAIRLKIVKEDTATREAAKREAAWKAASRLRRAEKESKRQSTLLAQTNLFSQRKRRQSLEPDFLSFDDLEGSSSSSDDEEELLDTSPPTASPMLSPVAAAVKANIDLYDEGDRSVANGGNGSEIGACGGVIVTPMVVDEADVEGSAMASPGPVGPNDEEYEKAGMLSPPRSGITEDEQDFWAQYGVLDNSILDDDEPIPL